MTISYKYNTFHLPTSRLVIHLLKRMFIYIKAAGGIVEEPDGKLLLITRNNRYDLPKGKVEPNETLRQAAIREVCEETGLSNVTPGNLILKTYHIYNLYGGWHLKQTSWFKMTTDAPYPIVGQTEEGIESGEWCQHDEWANKLQQSYGTMRTIVKHMKILEK